ncbi:MAG: acyl-CoA dehydrogenase family protein, partial [Caldilineaceae bacterium]
MPIEFRIPEEIEKQLRQVEIVAQNVMRPESRQLDDSEHARPVNFIHMMWPQMKEMERANLEASLRRAARNGNGETHGENGAGTNGAVKVAEKIAEKPVEKTVVKKQSIANLQLVHMIEMLSWGDAGVYLCIPASALAGAAIQAVGTPEQKERFLRRFTEGDPKWGAMAMTEPQAGSDTSNIQTTAVFDEATNEWVLNGQKIFCTSGNLAYAESDGLIVVWATVDKHAGRAGMKPFVVEAGTPGLKIIKTEEKLGIRASDTASFILDNCRIPADNVLGDVDVKQGKGNKGFKGAMRTFDATRPIVSASAIGIGRAAFEFCRDTLAAQGVVMDYESPRWKLNAAQADLLEMEIQLRQAWLLTLKATALLDAGEENRLEASMSKVKAGKAVTWITQKAVEL